MVVQDDKKQCLTNKLKTLASIVGRYDHSGQHSNEEVDERKAKPLFLKTFQQVNLNILHSKEIVNNKQSSVIIGRLQPILAVNLS